MTTKRRAPPGSKVQEDSVGLYMSELGRYPLLTKQDEVELATAIAAGRVAADALQDGSERAIKDRRQLGTPRRGVFAIPGTSARTLPHCHGQGWRHAAAEARAH